MLDTAPHQATGTHDDQFPEFNLIIIDPLNTSSEGDSEEHSADNSVEGTKSQYVGANFVLRGLTQVATNQIIQDVTVAMENIVDCLESSLMKKIEDLGMSVTQEQLAEIKSIFSDEKIVRPFNGLETEYKQERFMSDHFNYVVSSMYIAAHTCTCMFVFFRCLCREYLGVIKSSGLAR